MTSSWQSGFQFFFFGYWILKGFWIFLLFLFAIQGGLVSPRTSLSVFSLTRTLATEAKQATGKKSPAAAAAAAPPPAAAAVKAVEPAKAKEAKKEKAPKELGEKREPKVPLPWSQAETIRLLRLAESFGEQKKQICCLGGKPHGCIPLLFVQSNGPSPATLRRCPSSRSPLSPLGMRWPSIFLAGPSRSAGWT